LFRRTKKTQPDAGRAAALDPEAGFSSMWHELTVGGLSATT